MQATANEEICALWHACWKAQPPGSDVLKTCEIKYCTRVSSLVTGKLFSRMDDERRRGRGMFVPSGSSSTEDFSSGHGTGVTFLALPLTMLLHVIDPVGSATLSWTFSRDKFVMGLLLFNPT